MDLANSQNWHLVGAFTKEAPITYQDEYRFRYLPLPASEFQVSSPILSVYVKNQYAEEHWFLGCWASLYVQINGRWQRIKDANGEFSIRCRLDDYSLLTYPYFEPVPYKLKLDIPYWHRAITIEVSEFIDQSGAYLDPSTERLMDLLEGEEITLVHQSTRSSELDSALIITRFVEPTKYERFQVGRFYAIESNQEVGDPLIRTEPNRLIVEFTGDEPIEPGTIKVRVTP